MAARRTMGEVYADTRILLSKGNAEDLRLLVDTGATYTWIPGTLARRLGIRATEIIPFEIANGKTIRRRVGEVAIEVLGRRAVTIVVFAAKRDANVLGQYALAGLRLQVDPAGHRLVPRRTALAVSHFALGMSPRRRPRSS